MSLALESAHSNGVTYSSKDDEPLRQPLSEALARQRWRGLLPPGGRWAAQNEPDEAAGWPGDDGEDDAYSDDDDGYHDAASEDDLYGGRPLWRPGHSGRAGAGGAARLAPGAGDDWPTDDDAAWWQRAATFGREHVAVVAVALVVGLVFAVMTFLRARPDEIPLDTPGGTAVTVSAGVAPSAEPASTPPALIKVHVLGAVARPGVVTLPLGARVADAIDAAGGLTDDADPAQLNLAAVVADGAQIVIGTTRQPQGDINEPGGAVAAGGAGAGGTTGLVNLNTASQAALEALPGVGPVTAQKILAWRSQHGRFNTVAELQEVDGIGPKTLAQLEPYVCV